jgi:hypothetical protein
MVARHLPPKWVTFMVKPDETGEAAKNQQGDRDGNQEASHAKASLVLCRWSLVAKFHGLQDK